MSSASLEFAPYNPTFITGQFPDQFTENGGLMTPQEAQAYFLQESKKIIDIVANDIITTRQKGGDLHVLFNRIIVYTSEQRAEIARKQGSPDLEEEGFGVRRDTRMARNAYLLLAGQYKKTGDKIFELFTPYIASLRQKIRPLIVLKDQCDHRISTLTLSLLNPDDASNREFCEEPDDALLKKIKWIDRQDSCDTDPQVQIKIKENRTEFHCSCPVLYNQVYQELGMGALQYLVGKSLDFSDFFYLDGLLETEENGKQCELTRYMIGMHPTDNVFSDCMLVHQDPVFLQNTLEETATFFAKAVSWDGHSIEQLKDIMAHFCYLSAHNMRDFRGTAAQTEWITHAIFRSLGLFYTEDKSTMVDLEAFANPLFSKFRTRYHEIVQLYPVGNFYSS